MSTIRAFGLASLIAFAICFGIVSATGISADVVYIFRRAVEPMAIAVIGAITGIAGLAWLGIEFAARRMFS